MKRLLLPAFFLFSVTNAFAQTFQWVTSNGNVSEDRAHAVTTDADGNTFVTGQLFGTVSYGTFTLDANQGESDVFVVKYDTSGNAVWGFTAGGFGDDGGYGISTDANGNVFVAGTFNSTAVFGPDTLTSYAGFDNDIFVLVLNPNGNLLWVKQAGGAGYDAARGISVSGNNVFVCGGIVDTAYFGTTQVYGYGFGDVFVACYNVTGSLDWVKAFGGTYNDLAFGITSDAMSNTYTTGYFQDTATFGTTVLINGHIEYTDMFVVKTNVAGTVLWAKKAGGTNSDEIGRGIAVDQSGNTFVTGDFTGISSFEGQNLFTFGSTDAFVAKYNDAGAMQWVKQYGGTGTDRGFGVTANDSFVFATGSFSGTAQFGSINIASAGGTDVWIARLDNATGNTTSAVRAGGAEDDAGRSIFDGNGASSGSAPGLVAAGDFDLTASFGSDTLTSSGAHDYFVTLLDPMLNMYPCPFTPTLIPDHLTLCPNTAEVFTTQNYDSYQWMQNGTPITGATQINYLIHANTDSGSVFSVIVSLNGCTDTSDVGTVTTHTFDTLQIHQSTTGWMIGDQINFCEGDTLVLTLLPPYDHNIEWFRGSAVVGTSTMLYVTETGLYNVVASPALCPSHQDQLSHDVDVNVHSIVQPQILPHNDTLFALPAGYTYQWYKDSVSIGTTSPFLVPTGAGSYTVMAVDTVCTVMSHPFVITSVRNQSGIAFTAFPNPASDVLHLDNINPASYRLFDSTGRMVQEGIVVNKLDVSGLANGVYILRPGVSGDFKDIRFAVHR